MNHLKLEKGSRSYDIAILKLSEAFTFNNFVQPACLSSANVNNGKQCKLSGLNKDSDITEAKLTKVSNDFCRNWFKKEGRFISQASFTLRLGIHDNQHLCTDYVDGAVDTCYSGVGGGIWCETDSEPVLQGVTSFGKSCDAEGTPGVAINVSFFYGWIQATVQNTNNCSNASCAPGVCIETSDNAEVRFSTMTISNST